MINQKGKKRIALLLDPDETKSETRDNLLVIAEQSRTDYILIGGSLTYVHPGDLINHVKSTTSIPVFLFPGNLLQLTEGADGVLLLSLISGRNPELLIGNHVVAAPFLRRIKSNVISVGYILVNCGQRTSVEYMSQTEAIPSNKTNIAVATAIAGEMLGLKMIYLEAGSGADHPVPTGMIRSVKENITVPLIVGGGLNNKESIQTVFEAGADIVVLGNGCESDPSLLEAACSIRDSLN
ncbi:MAG TPA: geranylgeranylglyceryl/heptaprenylglyceryl phosphate synthase [Bacteroidales bacterium]|nr:geranylgeranylglyceryl/heptaprenylglyceryl phosphate synthase [Bacteroidales bacterium]